MNLNELEKLTLGQDMDARSATEIVGWAWETFKDDLVFSCSFSAGDMVLLDMLARIDVKPKIVFVDSCRLIPETYEFIDVVMDRYRIKPVFYFPDTKKLAAYLSENAPNALKHDRELRLACCEIRRHEPLRRAIAGHKAWMAGLRRSQCETRRAVTKVSMDPVHEGIAKICPIADWSWEQVFTYAKEHSVPVQPLYEQGYMSIGCAPCTRASSSGDERAGRWWWESSSEREDGVHFNF